MLTQKGKEPFIRMKLFLEDETAIHRLVASQYKIAPDRLMRTGACKLKVHMSEMRVVTSLYIIFIFNEKLRIGKFVKSEKHKFN